MMPVCYFSFIIGTMKKHTVLLFFRQILICMFILISGCGKRSGESAMLTGEPSDMNDYVLLQGIDHAFYDLDVEGMVKAMKDKKTFAVYFGYPSCEWCMEAAPVLNQAALENEMQVGYINTRSNPLWEKNTEIENYDLLVENVGEFLEYDSEGIRHLYTPAVFFIREGKVIGFHEGTVPDHNARNRMMTVEEREELLNTYRGMFEQLKTGNGK